jgi:hypothetical protein
VHDSSKFDIDALFKQINSTVSSHQAAWKHVNSSNDSWVEAPPGALKINFDVAVASSFSVAAAIVTGDYLY